MTAIGENVDPFFAKRVHPPHSALRNGCAQSDSDTLSAESSFRLARVHAFKFLRVALTAHSQFCWHQEWGASVQSFECKRPAKGPLRKPVSEVRLNSMKLNRLLKLM